MTTPEESRALLAEYDAHVEWVAKAIIDEMKREAKREWTEILNRELLERTDQDEWVLNDEKAILILTYSDHPCAGIFWGTGPVHSKDINRDPEHPFPFSKFAAPALEADVKAEIDNLLRAEGVDLTSPKYRKK